MLKKRLLSVGVFAYMFIQSFNSLAQAEFDFTIPGNSYAISGGGGTCASPNGIQVSVSGIGTLNTTDRQIAKIEFSLNTSCGNRLTDLEAWLKAPDGTCSAIATSLGASNLISPNGNQIDYLYISREAATCLTTTAVDKITSTGGTEFRQNVSGRFGAMRTTGNITTDFNGINADGTWTLFFITPNASYPCITSAKITFGNPQPTDATSSGDQCTNAIVWNGEPTCASTSGAGSSTNSPGFNGTYLGSFGCDWNASNDNHRWLMFVGTGGEQCITVSGISGGNQQSIVVTDANIDNDNNACTGAGGGTYWQVVSCPDPNVYGGTSGTTRNQNHCFTSVAGQTYYLIVDGNGGATSDFYITGVSGFNPPTASCPSDFSVCVNAPSFALSGASPLGGTYSGTGVNAGNFDPTSAGIGAHVITYTVDINGTPTTCQFTITVSAASSGFDQFASATQLTINSSATIYNTSGSGVDCINTDCNVLLDGQNLGAFDPNSGLLVLSGAEIKTEQTGGNVCSSTMHYRLTRVGDTPGAFTTVNLSTTEECVDTNSDGTVDTFNDGFGPCTVDDQKWKNYGINTDLTQGICEGNYTLEVYYEVVGSDCDPNGCDVTKTFDNNGNFYVATFSINAIPTPSVLSVTQPTCSTPTGSIQLGNLPNGNWTINPGNITGNSNTNTISNLNPGNYSYQVSFNGCTSASSTSTTINAAPANPATPVISVTAQPTCSSPTGTILCTAPVGANLEYSIDGSNFQISPEFTGLVPGNYTVTVRFISDPACEAVSASVTINPAPGTPAAPTGNSPQTFCLNENASVADLQVNGSAITWYTAATGGTVISTTTPLVNGGTYFASQTVNGCESTSRLAVTVVISAIQISSSINNTPICGNNTGEIALTISGGVSPYAIVWNTGDTNDTLSTIGEGTYTVTVTDAAGCTNSHSSTLTCVLSEIPEIITPGSNGKNETWDTGLSIAYPNLKVNIFNRWGNEVYKAQPYLDDWNGKCNTGIGCGEDFLPSGTYFYIIDLGNGSTPLSGYIELVK